MNPTSLLERALGLCALSLVLGAPTVGCSAGADASTEGAGSGAGSGSGGNSTGSFSTGVGGGGPCVSCSSDLHSVIDCEGNVLQVCAADLACSPTGTCVPACQGSAENKSTIGCDFITATPAVLDESRGSCFAVMIANTWTSPVAISATYGSQTIDGAQYAYIPSGLGPSLTYQPLPGGMLPPGQIGILFLSKYESGDIFQLDCPVTQALEMSTQVDGSGMGQAFHIQTTAPVIAYDVYPWGGSPSVVSSATLLLPTPTWGTNFVTADAWEALVPFGNPWTQVVAAQDGTTVTMVPVTNLIGGNGVPSGAANTPVTFTLNAGQVAQFLQNERLAGSALQSDKPISVWGGSSCMNIPTGIQYCDAAHQQLLPVQSLGNDYIVARYPTRGGDDSAPVTLIGMVDGTSLTFDPAPSGAPPSLGRGQVAILWTDAPFTVKSQDADHPFYVAAHMTGSGTGSGIGDPEYVNVVPPAQYLSSYLFATDPTYRNTALVFSRKRAADGFFKDVTLDCLGTVGGWQAVGSTGQYEVARIYIVQNGAGVAGCENGVHTALSEVGFGLTAWGFDVDVSYAYPAGMSLEAINTVVVPPIPQ